ncbi:MAG: hypothetical protein SNJ82_13125 [Gemmataceae bacterium]
MQRVAGMLLLSLSVGLVNGVDIKPGDAPTMTYEQLGQVVRSHKGKVLLVYFWADY